MVNLVLSCTCTIDRFNFTLISILFRAEVRALLCFSVLFNIFDHVIYTLFIAICFIVVLANKINNNKTRRTCGFLADIVVSGNARLVLESFRRVADAQYCILILRVTVSPPAVFRRVSIEPVHVDVLVQTKPV